MWITAFMCGGAGILLGSRLSARGILLIVSATLGGILFLYSLVMMRGDGWASGLFCFFPALCFFLSFCLLLAERFQKQPPFPSCLFGFFLANALIISLLFSFAIASAGSVSVSPLLFLFVLPFWACAVLAWRLRTDWLTPSPPVLPPELPVEADLGTVQVEKEDEADRADK
ncbi:MAG TPA: hypothetical protein PLA90_18100 [Candidatus Sumerlaeota bacterium]|nr:hypothetical protein [Candidatus Sumerlaeota bacterium]HPS03451.1 hypothetical protein [Candidatus Sumerlaeota bacterium]